MAPSTGFCGDGMEVFIDMYTIVRIEHYIPLLHLNKTVIILLCFDAVKA